MYTFWTSLDPLGLHLYLLVLVANSHRACLMVSRNRLKGYPLLVTPTKTKPSQARYVDAN